MQSLWWDSAKNRLLSGQCKRVTYAPDQGACNSFVAICGRIHKVIDESDRCFPAEPDYPNYKFVVVE